MIPGISSAVGAVNYFQVQLAKTDYLSVRTDFLNDVDGQRTGYKTKMTSNTIGWGHYFSPSILIRPELRYDHAWNAPAFDKGTKKNQFTALIDILLRF